MFKALKRCQKGAHKRQKCWENLEKEALKHKISYKVLLLEEKRMGSSGQVVFTELLCHLTSGTQTLSVFTSFHFLCWIVLKFSSANKKNGNGCLFFFTFCSKMEEDLFQLFSSAFLSWRRNSPMKPIFYTHPLEKFTNHLFMFS